VLARHDTSSLLVTKIASAWVQRCEPTSLELVVGMYLQPFEGVYNSYAPIK